MPDLNPHVQTSFDQPNPDVTPINLSQLVTLLNLLVHSEITGSYMPYVLQSGTPSVDDQDKAWIELDSQGRPKAIKTFWHGSWRRVYNGMLGEIRGFSGDPGYNTSGNFNSTGLGNAGGDYDGWALCNGQNGTPNLTDKFIIGAHMRNADGSAGGYASSQWQTWVRGDDHKEHTGGAKDFTLTAATTYRPATSAVRFRHWLADGNAPQPHSGNLYGVKAGPANEVDNDDLIPADAGKPTPDKVEIINPFIAFGWIIFVGYA